MKTALRLARAGFWVALVAVSPALAKETSRALAQAEVADAAAGQAAAKEEGAATILVQGAGGPVSRPLLIREVLGGGPAVVDSANTVWDAGIGMFRCSFRFSRMGLQPNVLTGKGDLVGQVRDLVAGLRDLLPPRDAQTVTANLSNNREVADLLEGWFRAGTAGGNYGDLYDNRDAGHSALPSTSFPQLARVRYGADLPGADHGFNDAILFNAPTVGNASLAFTSGIYWRSLPRAALTTPHQLAALVEQYASNQVYVYPEHRDHDPDHGDLFPANTPYMLISQGSSGSDQPLVQAVAAILAAFAPETKRFLVRSGLIAPTVQWILRRSLRGVDTDVDYLTGLAHPSVFDGRALSATRMIALAHGLEPGEVPPVVRMRVVEESGQPGAEPLGERLFDTPSAIARIARSPSYARRLIVDARGTFDPNGRPLTFKWSVLRGDADRISIKPLNDEGSLVEIVVPWHDRYLLDDRTETKSDRVDIGVFANNGVHWSAPGFVSILFPTHEHRTYRPDHQIAAVDYLEMTSDGRYVDPLLFPTRPWRDDFSYDEAGRPLGWDRTSKAGVSRFTSDGARVVSSDGFQRPLIAERIEYRQLRLADGRTELVEVPTGRLIRFSYASDEDRTGQSSEWTIPANR